MTSRTGPWDPVVRLAKRFQSRDFMRICFRTVSSLRPGHYVISTFGRALFYEVFSFRPASKSEHAEHDDAASAPDRRGGRRRVGPRRLTAARVQRAWERIGQNCPTNPVNPGETTGSTRTGGRESHPEFEGCRCVVMPSRVAWCRSAPLYSAAYRSPSSLSRT